MEVISKEPLIIIDGGHNIDASLNIVSFLKRVKNDKHVIMIYQSLNDKDYINVIKNLDLVSDEYYIFDFDDVRKTKKEDIASNLSKPYHLFDTIEELASNIDYSNNNIIVFFGSFHISFDVKKELLKNLNK